MRPRKFTTSKDGVERCNLYVKLRLTREELDILERYAKEEDQSVRKLLECELGLSLEGRLYDWQADLERKTRGGSNDGS